MAPSTRLNPALSKKIATMQLTLAPFIPLPSGPPHPAFPKTLLAFHLLTEDELDSLAHYYHQSTPGPWTYSYPTTMNWDKNFLAKPDPAKLDISAGTRRLSVQEEQLLSDIMQTVSELTRPETREERRLSMSQAVVTGSYANLTDRERIRIKKRKFGKFIGLVGMETPLEEIAGRLQADIDRAIERSREELARNEEFMLGRRKAF